MTTQTLTRASRNGRSRIRRNGERDAEIVRLRAQGVSVHDIAEQFGVSEGRVSQVYTRALRELPAADIEIHRKEQSERIEAVINEASAIVVRNRGINIEHDEIVLNALRTILRALTDKAKLFGLNAPERAELAIEHIRYETVGIDIKELA